MHKFKETYFNNGYKFIMMGDIWTKYNELGDLLNGEIIYGTYLNNDILYFFISKKEGSKIILKETKRNPLGEYVDFLNSIIIRNEKELDYIISYIQKNFEKVYNEVKNNLNNGYYIAIKPDYWFVNEYSKKYNDFTYQNSIIIYNGKFANYN